MVILSGSNIGSTQPHSLPSPARGSPPGISPNKNIAGTTPELSGLERMLQGWRRQAAKKAEQFRQRDLDGEAKRQKEQNEINEIRLKIIEARMKKIEQQQQSAVKNSKNNGSILGDPTMEQNRKRRSDDDYYLGTPSDSGFSCDSPDAFGVESGYCATKNVKLSVSSDKPSPVEKNASVFIETFHLPPPPSQTQTASKRPNMARSHSQIPAYPVPSNQPAGVAHSASFNFDATSAISVSAVPQIACAQVPRPPDDQQSMGASSVTSLRGQMGDVALPRDIEEEMIRALPLDLDAALTPDFMRAIDDLEWAPSSNARAPTTQQPKVSVAIPPSSGTVSAAQYATLTRPNLPQPSYAPPQHYPSLAQQQIQASQHQHYYNMVNRSSALGAWHQPPPFAAAPSAHYANQYPMNGQNMMHLQQQVPRPGWPQQGMLGNPSAEFNHQF